jgi:hypothetical protein
MRCHRAQGQVVDGPQDSRVIEGGVLDDQRTGPEGHHTDLDRRGLIADEVAGGQLSLQWSHAKRCRLYGSDRQLGPSQYSWNTEENDEYGDAARTTARSTL